MRLREVLKKLKKCFKNLKLLEHTYLPLNTIVGTALTLGKEHL